MAGSDDVAALADLFRGFAGAHGTHGEPVLDPTKGKFLIRTTARTLREPVTPALWQRHVTGERPLGVITVREDGTCLWGSVDVDDYAVDVVDVLRKVEGAKLPLVPCRSKSGGLHLFLFLTEPTPAGDVQSALKDMAARIGYASAEIFPKQTTIDAARGDLGSWMVMPYFGSTYDGAIFTQAGLRTTGAELTLAEFVRTAQAARIAPADLPRHRGAVSAGRTSPRQRTQGQPAIQGGPFSDGPPCLQHLAAAKVQPGGQNNTLLMMGIYYKKARPDDWAAALQEASHTLFAPPADPGAVESAISSLRRKDYEYTCRTAPMCDHCDSRTCRTRRHGVGAWGDFPSLSGLSVITTDPAIWFVDVDGRRVELQTDDLVLYPKFHKVCVERLHVCFRPMAHNAWMEVLNAAMADVVVIDAPEEARPGAELRDRLVQFLTNRRRGLRREDILDGRPWEDEEGARHWFQLAAFTDFLRREGDKGYTRGQVSQFLKEGMGGGREQMHIGDVGRSVFWVPADAVEVPRSASVPPVAGASPI